jgi:hypothetical protein
MTDDLRKLYNAASGNESVTPAGPVLHVRVQGRSRDIALDLLDIGPGSSDEAIRNAVAQFMEITPALLRHTVVERHENGNITLRPEAVFG